MNELTSIALVITLWNIVTYSMYGIDKGKAIKRKRRISEARLIGSAFLMGGIGALVGMRVYRHKTKRMKFRVLVPLAAIANIGAIACYIYFR